MYWLMSIGAIVRIAVAMAFLFVVIPALAWPRRKTATVLEWFFWNLGVGIVLITLVGQLLALGNLSSLLTILLMAALVVLLARAAFRDLSPWTLLRRAAEDTILGVLNVFDGRVNLRRRVRRIIRRGSARLRGTLTTPLSRVQMAAWLALIAVAAGLRLYRPFVSANLGFSDTYVHLYLLKLLEQGQQVDPEWGPYPRGLQFVLLAIHQLTNVDEILLMNFFGAFVGVLMVLAVTDATRRLTGSLLAGFTSGFLFATMIGGVLQYFILGGAFDAETVRAFHALPYEEIRAGEFDIVLTTFQRQTSTLPQELAIALLLPVVLFLRDFLRSGQRWHLAGFAGGTAAIAACHTGVLAPLALVAVLMLLAMAAGEEGFIARRIRAVFVAGVLAVLAGSSWMVAFFRYPYAGGKGPGPSSGTIDSNPTLHYYFPFLESLAGKAADRRIFVELTPFLAVCIALAAGLLLASVFRSDERRSGRLWIASTFLLFLLLHFSSVLGLPQLIEIRRNSQWLTMSMAILIGVAISEIGALARFLPRARVAIPAAVLLILLAAWTFRIPRLSDPAIHDRIVNYSGYGASALAVLRIERTLEPYTWTIVSYGQEFPMVMQRGFHLSAMEFLDRYDPQREVTPIPTPSIFIIVEKTVHPFQINTWARRFSRAELQQRLQTWIHLYQMTHTNMRVFLEDETVRVYQIERTKREIDTLSPRAKP